MRAGSSEAGPAWPGAAGYDAADWLHLAAAPLFAVMALVTALLDGGPSPICSIETTAWPLGGMASMYALMGVVHAAPWLRLATRRRRR